MTLLASINDFVGFNQNKTLLNTGLFSKKQMLQMGANYFPIKSRSLFKRETINFLKVMSHGSATNLLSKHDKKNKQKTNKKKTKKNSNYISITNWTASIKNVPSSMRKIIGCTPCCMFSVSSWHFTSTETIYIVEGFC